MSPKRSLVYRFCELPHVIKLQIAADLKLMEKSDEKLTDQEKFHLYFVRAGERDILDKMWDEIESHREFRKTEENPFRKPKREIHWFDIPVKFEEIYWEETKEGDRIWYFIKGKGVICGPMKVFNVEEKIMENLNGVKIDYQTSINLGRIQLLKESPDQD